MGGKVFQRVWEKGRCLYQINRSGWYMLYEEFKEGMTDGHRFDPYK